MAQKWTTEKGGRRNQALTIRYRKLMNKKTTLTCLALSKHEFRVVMVMMVVVVMKVLANIYRVLTMCQILSTSNNLLNPPNDPGPSYFTLEETEAESNLVIFPGATQRIRGRCGIWTQAI